MNCRNCWRSLQKENERMAGLCECCQDVAQNFDRRSWMDQMFVNPAGGEY
jgi:hypothetical protein